MKNKKFKKSNIFLIGILAIAGMLGVSNLVIDKQVKENAVAEKAEAATNTTVYYAINTTYTVKCNVNRQGDASNWATYTMSKDGTKTYYGKQIYKANFTDLYDGLGCLQFQLYDGSTWKSQVEPISKWTAASAYNGKLYDGSNWVTYSTDSNPTYTLYIDATNWSSGIGSYTPFCHYWNDGYYGDYSDATGVNLTSVSGGGTYSNKKWWSFTISPYQNTSLKFKFAYNGYAMETGEISYSANNKAYYVSGTKSAAPVSSFTSDGSVYKIERKRKLGSASSTLLGTDYVLGGESYQIPAVPGAVAGYTTPTKWNSSEAGTGTEYTPTTDWISNILENKNIYALYVAATYTITYDRNNAGDTSVTATRTKEYNVAHELLDPSEDLSWSPSADKRFIGWAETRDGSATYSVGDNYTGNAAKTFYYNEDWYNYRYKINSGSWINLTHNDTNKPSGVKAQFQSSSQTLPLNAILTFQYSTDGGTNWSSLTVSDFEGNYDSSTGIKMQTTDTIYLKLNDDRSYTCWVPGISDRSIAVCASATATSGTTYSMRSNGYTETVTTSYVYVQKGQYIRRGYDGTLYDTYLVSGGASSYFSQVTENATNVAILCNMTGAYTVYNQAGSYSNWADVYIERNESESAKYLAQLFNSTISSVCTAITGGSKGLSDLQAVWGSTTTSDLYKHFNGQPTTTMSYFTGATSTSDTDILGCIERYNYIENKYGTAALPNFLGRSDPYKVSLRDFSPMSLFGGSEDNFSTVIIIVSSSVALLSITALSILVIKKRKQKEE